MNEIEKMFEQCFDSNDPGLQREFYEEVCLLVSSADEESIKDKNIIDESMLNKLLADCSRAISRVIEKYKVSPSSVDDYYFFSSSIFKSLLENSTFANLNDLRGLYTCLNVVKIHKEYSKYLQSKIFQANVIREFNAVAKRYTD
jgi:galactose-1-phosphate uridylyltransferase